MPYLKDEDKARLQEIVDSVEGVPLTHPGQLNYLFCKLAMEYILENEESYQTYNDIIGALEDAKLELYRRKVSIYEDLKIKNNGDVFLGAC